MQWPGLKQQVQAMALEDFRRQSTAQANKAQSLVQDSACPCLFLRVQCSVQEPPIYSAPACGPYLSTLPKGDQPTSTFQVKPLRLAKGGPVELQSFETTEILSNHVESTKLLNLRSIRTAPARRISGPASFLQAQPIHVQGAHS